MRNKPRSKSDRQAHSVSSPADVIRAIHLDRDLNWSFDPSVDPHAVFAKLKPIGRGGFGTVSQILHQESMRLLAGKLIIPNLIDERTKAAIFNEIELLRTVVSPYTVRYYGTVNFDGSLMILMEYCDRGSLRDIMDHHQFGLDEEQIALILTDVLKGIQIIHDKYHIIHRDIKAANILMNSQTGSKIADFGVSRQFESGTQETVTIVGTPYWMAPEVIQGIGYTFSADIWSIGITAVELAEGAPPYIELTPSKAMIEIAIKGFPGYRYPGLHSEEFRDFVECCVQMDPNQRSTPEQLLNHPFLQRAPLQSRRQVLSELILDQIPKLTVSSAANSEAEFLTSFEASLVDPTFPPIERKSLSVRPHRIPYVPFKLGTNPSLQISDLYKMSDKVPEPEPKMEYFDEFGIVRVSEIIKHPSAPPVVAGAISILVFKMLGLKWIIALVYIALLVRAAS